MKKKRPKPKPQKPPPERGGLRPAHVSLQYKVVELSTVDEGSIERTLNEWTPRGWALENVQFAMRESSKRPAMAFVFFTREAAEVTEHDEDEARAHLVRLSQDAFLQAEPEPEPEAPRPGAISPRARLAQLAGLDEDEDSSPDSIEWKDLEPDE